MLWIFVVSVTVNLFILCSGFELENIKTKFSWYWWQGCAQKLSKPEYYLAESKEHKSFRKAEITGGRQAKENTKDI